MDTRREEKLAALKAKRKPTELATTIYHENHTNELRINLPLSDIGKLTTLDALLISSPMRAYNNNNKLTPLGMFGLFSKAPAIRQETADLANEQKPFLVDHLRGMSEIRSFDIRKLRSIK